MSEDQFTKLFVYMEKRFDAVDHRFVDLEERMDKRFDTLTSVIDGLRH